eukprot:m.52357 g.52357  ORF g.52357 m.52357 type:complete len:684 (+) comp48449_c0_seq1:102-2153(+)
MSFQLLQSVVRGHAVGTAVRLARVRPLRVPLRQLVLPVPQRALPLHPVQLLAHHQSSHLQQRRHWLSTASVSDSTDKDGKMSLPREAESKVEKTVSHLRAQKEEEAKNRHLADLGSSAPPVQEVKVEVKAPLYVRMFTGKFWADLWKATKEELHHYKAGFQLLWTNIRVSSRLVRRVLDGHQLTRREKNQLVRTSSDLLLMLPFSVFIVVPFAEFTLPIFIKIFPNMLPSTFQHATDNEAKLRAQLKVKLEMAKFLQETVEEMAAQRKDTSTVSSNVVAEFAQFLESSRTQNLTVPTEEILKFSKLFDNELTLDNLSRQQIVALCKLLLINSLGTTSFLRFQLRMKLRELRADDVMILNEGISSLSTSELQQACRDRGMRALGISREDLETRLQTWLELHVKKEVPASLLLLSRVMYLPDALPETERIAAVVNSLPETAKVEAKISMLEAEGEKIHAQDRLALVKKEEQLIQVEQAEEFAEKEKVSVTQAAQVAQSEMLVDPADVPNAKEKITLEDLDDLAEAMMSKSTKVERLTVEELIVEVKEHKQDLEALSGVSEAKLVVPSVSVKLTRKVETMLEEVRKNLQALEQQEKKSLPDDQDLKVPISDLIQAMKNLKNPPSAAKLTQIAEVLDADHDGVVALDVVNKVAELALEEGEDISSENLARLVKLVEAENALSKTKKA